MNVWAENWRRERMKEERMRTFDTGATRDSEAGKFDYEGFMSPLVVRRFGAYMYSHRVQADGALRSGENWQRGIPKEVYIKSAFRHFVDWWLAHRGHRPAKVMEDALCGLLFNVQGYLHELLIERARGTHEQEKLDGVSRSDFHRMLEEPND